MQTKSWRSGSGMLGTAGRNSCVKNKGWLPNGTYAVRQHNDYGGNLIKGRAFRIDNKGCPNGTGRVDLFVHTEQGARNRQCANRRGDQVCRWEYPRYNDYKSPGCIKLAPGAPRRAGAALPAALRRRRALLQGPGRPARRQLTGRPAHDSLDTLARAPGARRCGPTG